MKKIAYILLPLLLCVSGVFAQEGIKFFEGSFEQALEQAKVENKKVFVDFHTSWCVYCKKMAAEAFVDPQVGAYYNSRFINYKIDAESAEGKPIAAKYAVTAYPTLLITDAAGVEIVSAEGAMSAEQLLKWARTELGEQVTFEQLFDRLKADKDPALVRSLLLAAPEFLARQPEGSTYDRWQLRVERLYADYRKQKPIAELMTPEDFPILMAYHNEITKNDPVFEYIVANYPEVHAKVGGDKVDLYLFGTSSQLIGELAAKGDMEYEKYLERIKGDLKPTYDAMLKHDSMDSYSCMKYLNDATYYIYNRKNVDQYISLMDQYLTNLGKSAVAGDFSSATRNLYDALDGKLPENASRKGVEWISRALVTEGVDVGEQMELLIMNADCYKMLGDVENAKKCYKQAYVVSLQFQNPGLSAQITAMMENL